MGVDQVLFTEEVAVLLRVHHQTVRGHIRAGRLRAVKRGNRWFIRQSAVDEFVDGVVRGGG